MGAPIRMGQIDGQTHVSDGLLRLSALIPDGNGVANIAYAYLLDWHVAKIRAPLDIFQQMPIRHH
jgi:hypothetical protein